MSRCDRPSKASVQPPGMSHRPADGPGHSNTSASPPHTHTQMFTYVYKEEHSSLLFALLSYIFRIVPRFRNMELWEDPLTWNEWNKWKFTHVNTEQVVMNISNVGKIYINFDSVMV